MGFNLNDNAEFGAPASVFNNGEAGLVENVELSIEKKSSSDNPNSPDYKLIATDANGSVNEGYYYNPYGHESMSKEDLEKKQKMGINRLMEAARAVVPEGFVFPDVNSAKEAMDAIAVVIKDNAPGKKVRVFTNYGTVGYPKEFLQFRFFNYVQPMDGKQLSPRNDDMLTRPTPDSKPTGSAAADVAGDDWLAQ